MIASSGDQLIDNNAIDALINRLLPQATLVTPNIPEACRMTGVDIRSERDFDRAAEVFRRSGCRALLLKAGHLHGKTLTDMLYDFESGKVHGFEFERIDTANTHGTGCSLSASIAARMSQERVYAMPYKRPRNSYIWPYDGDVTGYGEMDTAPSTIS